MVIIHMKRIIIHFRGVKYRITSRIIICFIGCANKLYFSGPARVLLHTCVSTIDATHPCMCHVQAHEKIDFMNSIIPFLSIYEYLLPSIKCIAHSMIIDNCFQDFIEEFVNLNCVLLYLSILRTLIIKMIIIIITKYLFRLLFTITNI